jgi:long-chain acyl-CoA synthetase
MSVWGESVAALVRLNDGETLTEDALLSFLREQLAGFKVPSALHFVAQPLPRNAAGKLLKKQIKEEYATLAKV